ncbi:MAG: helical backbone metal receptor, partial [Ginsengibacter sp.]
GLKNEVIGITKFCVHPLEWRLSKSIIGGTKNINLKKINSLKPDLVIANKEENVKEDILNLSEDCNVLLTDINDLEGALETIKVIGRFTGKAAKSCTIAEEIEKSFEKLAKSKSGKKIEAAYFIWQKPYMAAGGDTFIDAMMECCGLNNVFKSMKRYPEVSLTDVARSGCKFLLLSSEPFPFKDKHLLEIQNRLPGVKVVLVDGEMFSWYGSRLLKAAPYLFHLRSVLVTSASGFFLLGYKMFLS